MANITRIKNNQITDANVVAYAKIQSGTITGNLFAPTVTLNSNLTIVGNLNVSGNTSSINSINTFVQDPLVVFNNGYIGSVAGYDIGVLINRNLSPLGPYGSVNTAWVWVENDQAFEGIATSTTGNALTSLTSTGFANLKIGNVTSVSETITNNLTAGSITSTPISGSTGYFTTAYTTDFSTANAQISGGAITSTPISGSTGYFTTAYTTDFSTANAQISGGAITSTPISGSTGYFTTAAATNFSAGNAIITGGTTYIGTGGTLIANIYAGTGYFTNLSTGNLSLTNLNLTTLQVNNFSTGNAVITGGSVNSTPIGAGSASTGAFTTLSASTSVATNFSTGNARITGGYADNFAIGANTSATGAFTTLTTSGVTILNANVVAASGTSSTNTTTGALVSTGGLGVAGNIYAGGASVVSAGMYSTGAFLNTYTDGIVVDYVGSNGRISVGAADNLTFYAGGPANTQTVSVSSAGILTATGNIVGNNIVTAGSAYIANLIIGGANGNTIISNTGKIGLGSISNLIVTGGTSGYTIVTDGAGNLSFTSLLGNSIQLGANVSGQLVSNAVSLTSTTDITDAVAQLNAILGKLVPSAPTSFPTATAVTGTIEYSGYMTSGFSQTDNSGTGWGNLAVSAGTLISNSTRLTTFSINSIANNGTTASGGNVQLYVNGVTPASSYHVFGTTASSADNGTYGEITIANAEDYHVVSSTVAAGFWYVFSVSSALTGVSAGWNRANLYYTGDAAGTNTLTWYYDASAPTAPAFSATSIALSSNTVTYSSTIPHLNSSAGFTLSGSVANLSGDLYYSAWTSTAANFFSSTGAGGALLAPANRTLTQVSVPLPLTRNNTSAYSFSTTSNVTTGFGSAVATAGPAVSVSTPYATTSSGAFQPGNIILYKTGTTTQIEETALTNSLSGTPSTYRIVNPDGGTAADNPAYTGTEATWNSSTSTLLATDATVVAAKLQYDVTNYSTGYLPVGPNLSSGRSGSQYFTFKFALAALSGFFIHYTGTLAGLWVAIPGVTDTPASPSNGWLNAAAAYGGSGTPGAGTGGNGTNGCAIGTAATLNSNGTYSVQVTFGTINTSSTGNKSNEVYVRVKLTSAQSLTALTIQSS